MNNNNSNNSNDIEYIQFFLKPTIKEPYVYYITNFQEFNKKRLVLPLNRFKTFLLENFELTNEEKEKVFNYLQEHKLVYINKKTKEILTQDIFENHEKVDFMTLWELNKPVEKEDYHTNVKNTLKEIIFSKNKNYGFESFTGYRKRRKF